MNENAAAPSVIDLPDQQRFVAELDGHSSELVYRADPGRLVIVHTGVSPQLQGRGVGGALVRAALARAAAEGLTVVPWCPFASQWLRAHPDAASGVTVDWDPPEP